MISQVAFTLLSQYIFKCLPYPDKYLQVIYKFTMFNLTLVKVTFYITDVFFILCFLLLKLDATSMYAGKLSKAQMIKNTHVSMNNSYTAEFIRELCGIIFVSLF